MAEDLSGLDVRKRGGQFTVTEKFTDIELFNGDSTQLIEYFKRLFSTDVYGDDAVKDRLRRLERGCRRSQNKYREVLEDILPQFKTFNQHEER